MESAYGNWALAVGISGLFLWFIFGVFKPKTRADWKNYGMFAAFVVALFTEMYGFPLTLYLLSSWIGSKFPQLNGTHASGHIWEILLGNTGDPHWSALHITCNLFIFGGILLIADAWKVLYLASQKNTLALTGPYRFIRHPQYTGFILIIIGFLLQWPTLITLVMAPILIIRYIRLANLEEAHMLRVFNMTYQRYKQSTPAFIPSMKQCTSSIHKTFYRGGEHL